MPYDITSMWNLKYNAKEHIYDTEADSQTQRLPGGGAWGRDGVGGWGQQMLTIIYRMGKQGPTVQRRELYLVFHGILFHNGKEYFKKECIWMYK